MNQTFAKYYRTDFDEQRAARKVGTRERIFFFTEEGYARLNNLITAIKQNDAGSPHAREEFAAIIAPWAEYEIARYTKPKNVVIDSGKLIKKTVDLISTNSEITGWHTFHERFNLKLSSYTQTAQKYMRNWKRERTLQADQSSARPEISERDPSAIAEQQELIFAVRKLIEEQSDTAQRLLGARLSAPSETQAQTAKALGLVKQAVNKQWQSVPQRFFVAAARHPALREWISEYGVSAESAGVISETGLKEIGKRKQRLRAIFGFTEDCTLAKICSTLGINMEYTQTLFGEFNDRYRPASSDGTLKKLGDYLRSHGKEDKIPELEDAFKELRELTGVKIKPAREPGAISR